MLKETIEIGGVWFVLNRPEGIIEIVDYHKSLAFTPATLAYVLQQYGEFTIKVDPTKKYGAVWGTTDAS